jgi:hypothetical protein
MTDFMLIENDMENLIKNLKKYFETNSRDTILEDWAKTKDYDQIDPILDHFLAQTNLHFKIKTEDPLIGYNLKFNNFSPQFSTGFFFNKKYVLCNKQLFQ